MHNTDLAGAVASASFPMPPGFYNMDCIEAMKEFPNKFFDLAIVDPPYGGGSISGKDGMAKDRLERETAQVNIFDCYTQEDDAP